MADLNFPLLKLINQARSTYGLRHQDYAKYQSHCTTKVHHLRKAVGLTQVAGKQKKYAKKDVTAANATSDKHLQILLFDTERAWAHAQLLKTKLDSASATATTRHHLARRLARAVLAADHLYSLVTELSAKVRVSERAQAAAYYLVLKGTLAFEQQRHQDGLNALSVAHSLLSTIATTSDTAHGEALANEAIDEIEPLLRFCAYTLHLNTSTGTGPLIKSTTEREKENLIKGYDSFVSELVQSGGRVRREAVSLSWRGKDIPIRNAQLVSVVLKVKTALKGLAADRDVVGAKASSSQKKVGGEQGEGKREVLGARRMGTYDRALLVLNEAQEVAAQLVEDNKAALSRVNTARSESSTAALQDALAYIVYHLLAVRTKRDLLLIEDTRAKLASREAKVRKAESDFVLRSGTKDPKTAEAKIRKQRARAYPGLVKVYDGIVQNLEQTRDVEAVEQDGELAAAVDARIAFVKASRGLVLSRSYALVDQFPSALSLNSRAKLYAREARSVASSLSPDAEFEDDFDFVGDLLSLTSNDFDRLDRELVADAERASNDWYTLTGGVTQPEELAIEDLDLNGGPKGGKNGKKKEAFYDVAFSYVAAFDMDAIARRAGKLPPLEVEEQQPSASVPAAVKSTSTDEVEEDEDEPDESPDEKPAPASRGWGFGLFGRK